MTDRFPNDWSNSEREMLRLRDWLMNYEGLNPRSPKETVDMFTKRYSEMRELIAVRPYPKHALYYDPRVLEKFRLQDTPAEPMTDR